MSEDKPEYVTTGETANELDMEYTMPYSTVPDGWIEIDANDIMLLRDDRVVFPAMYCKGRIAELERELQQARAWAKAWKRAATYYRDIVTVQP